MIFGFILMLEPVKNFIINIWIKMVHLLEPFADKHPFLTIFLCILTVITMGIGLEIFSTKIDKTIDKIRF